MTDGNKNVTALLDADGNRAAEYIYHPFGTICSKTGPMVDLNPFRFSSEQYDDETGLVYYNYRYYSPELGRWISRDPIEEEGGVNLYAMVGNNSVTKTDYLGLKQYSLSEIIKEGTHGRYLKTFTILVGGAADSTTKIVKQHINAYNKVRWI